MNFRNLRFKIILTCAVCIIVVGLLSNSLLYIYLTSIISEKADSINQLNLQQVQNHLNQTLYQFESLGDLCSNDIDIARAMRNQQFNTLSSKRDALKAYEALRRYLSASNIEKHILKLMIFNESGLMAQASNNFYGSWDDPDQVRELPIFDQMLQVNPRRTAAISPSIVNGENCIAMLSPIYDNTALVYKGWLYIEMNMNWLSEIIELYGSENFFIADSNGYFIEPNPNVPEYFYTNQPFANGQTIKNGSTIYKLQSTPLNLTELSIFSYSDITYLSNKGGLPVLYTTVVVILTSLVAALMLAALLSNIITRPLNRLMERIKKISENDFSYDPDIERGYDEIALTGKMINEMTGSVRNLLLETEEWYTRQKNAEIALLQSQVNPHFLYNTLDSIHWMATIQKNTGIMTMTKSLSALLKNLAKGVGNKITLKEELSLLQDYINIQSLRYIENFTYLNQVPEDLLSCMIVKFTLQPLVENAIFHGIEPKGSPGCITIDAKTDGELLIITVRDDGVGMDPEELTLLTDTEEKTESANNYGLSGMGVSNVHERLKLVYGEQYGLTCKSKKHQYTEVTVRIPKEI